MDLHLTTNELKSYSASLQKLSRTHSCGVEGTGGEREQEESNKRETLSLHLSCSQVTKVLDSLTILTNKKKDNKTERIHSD